MTRIFLVTFAALCTLGAVACGSGGDAPAANPCANPCAANPCAKADANPCAANPCAAPAANPCAAAKVAKDDMTGLEGADVANGEKVYNTTCLACHQKDGQGMGGTLAGPFVGPDSVLTTPNAVLLNSIDKGKTGTIGAMPAWGAVVDEQARKDVLAFIRTTFGKK